MVSLSNHYRLPRQCASIPHYTLFAPLEILWSGVVAVRGGISNGVCLFSTVRIWCRPKICGEKTIGLESVLRSVERGAYRKKLDAKRYPLNADLPPTFGTLIGFRIGYWLGCSPSASPRPVQHFVNGATMRQEDCNCFDRFLHSLRSVEMT